MDPTHGTFLHEGIVSDKTKAAPVAMSVAQHPTVEGFQARAADLCLVPLHQPAGCSRRST